MRLFAACTLLAAAAGLIGGGRSGAPEGPPSAAAEDTAVVLAAGDIASCSSLGDEATATVLDGLPGTVITLGDNAYDSGTVAEFTNCYTPSWGRHKARTRPSAGNHDYVTAGAAGYYAYFGDAAGHPSKGYYAFDVGAWRLIAINSNCGAIGGCGAGSAQERWLRLELAAHPKACVLAFWHHPRFSSGQHGDSTATQAIWQALYDYGADVVLSGHDHTYERFARQTPAGVADPTRGIREFVVGTGGRSHYAFPVIRPNSEVRNNDTYGVLELTLSDSGYAWDFVSEAGKTFDDNGSDTCHVDADGDEVADAVDNCAATANASQADSDGDGLGDGCEPSAFGTSPTNADSDGDNCRDGAEVRATLEAGGRRDPLDAWDFYDVNGDAAIELSDTLLVLAHFGHGPNEDALDDALDRRIPDHLAGWRPAQSNDGVDLSDALANLQSFGHDCSSTP